MSNDLKRLVINLSIKSHTWRYLPYLQIKIPFAPLVQNYFLSTYNIIIV